MVTVLREEVKYFTDTEKEAEGIVKEAKESNEYEIVKHSIEKKEKKEKGEIVCEYFILTLLKQYATVKELV